MRVKHTKNVQRKLETILMSINRRPRGLHVIKLYTENKRDGIFLKLDILLNKKYELQIIYDK